MNYAKAKVEEAMEELKRVTREGEDLLKTVEESKLTTEEYEAMITEFIKETND